MTTIAIKDGIIAADSRATIETDSGGVTKHPCEKLYRKTIYRTDAAGARVKDRDVIIATAGESSPALVFLDWYGSGEDPPDCLRDNDCDFTALIVEPNGVYEADKWCRPEKVLAPYYAIGSGRKEALGAMAHGATAAEAVSIAAMFDPYTGGEIVSMEVPKREAATNHQAAP